MIYIKNYIERQTLDNQLILYVLRDLILSFNPLIEERFSYKIPFYYFNKKPLCYLNVNKKGFVDLGFTKGYLMVDIFKVLQSQHLKQVRHLTFENVEMIEMAVIRHFGQQGIKMNDK